MEQSIIATSKPFKAPRQTLTMKYDGICFHPVVEAVRSNLGLPIVKVSYDKSHNVKQIVFSAAVEPMQVSSSSTDAADLATPSPGRRSVTLLGRKRSVSETNLEDFARTHSSPRAVHMVHLAVTQTPLDKIRRTGAPLGSAPLIARNQNRASGPFIRPTALQFGGVV